MVLWGLLEVLASPFSAGKAERAHVIKSRQATPGVNKQLQFIDESPEGTASSSSSAAAVSPTFMAADFDTVDDAPSPKKTAAPKAKKAAAKPKPKAKKAAAKPKPKAKKATEAKAVRVKSEPQRRQGSRRSRRSQKKGFYCEKTMRDRIWKAAGTAADPVSLL